MFHSNQRRNCVFGCSQLNCHFVVAVFLNVIARVTVCSSLIKRDPLIAHVTVCSSPMKRDPLIVHVTVCSSLIKCSNCRFLLFSLIYLPFFVIMILLLKGNIWSLKVMRELVFNTYICKN